jgi:hypothetical protein
MGPKIVRISDTGAYQVIGKFRNGARTEFISGSAAYNKAVPNDVLLKANKQSGLIELIPVRSSTASKTNRKRATLARLEKAKVGRKNSSGSKVNGAAAPSSRAI